MDESSYKTLYTYINRLRNVNQWFKNKPWNKLTEKEIKQVYNDLEDGKITNRAGKRFIDRRGYYNKVFKAKPFKLAGLHDKVENALEFFTDKSKKEVRFVNEDGFKRMHSFLQKPQHFVLFWLAWDIGENITSFLELRVKHFKRQINKDTKEIEYLVYLPEDTLKRSRQTRSEPTIYPETVRYLDALFKYGREVEYRDEKGHIRRKPIPYKEDDFVFTFKYRQALQIFQSVAKRSGVRCEPHGETPSWKDLRSGMACHLFAQGWHVEDINLRLGHSPQSKWLQAYINYLAVNRKRVIKTHYDNNLEDIKNELEESKQREKLTGKRLERQKQDLDSLKTELDAIKNGKGFMTLISGLVKQEMAKAFEQATEKNFDLVIQKPEVQSVKYEM
ncbi:MAG: site-specific integrase [candidate division Zixibacteria bacterium]|nr:site-specific integrase [candidate division Zixibacteria bacterium]